MHHGEQKAAVTSDVRVRIQASDVGRTEGPFFPVLPRVYVDCGAPAKHFETARRRTEPGLRFAQNGGECVGGRFPLRRFANEHHRRKCAAAGSVFHQIDGVLERSFVEFLEEPRNEFVVSRPGIGPYRPQFGFRHPETERGERFRHQRRRVGGGVDERDENGFFLEAPRGGEGEEGEEEGEFLHCVFPFFADFADLA